MYKPKLEKDIRCPLEYGLTVFGGKWKSRVICVLAEKGTLRYSALHSSPCRTWADREGALYHPHPPSHLSMVRRVSPRRERKRLTPMSKM